MVIARFDSVSNMSEAYTSYIDKAKLFNTIINLIGIAPTDLGNKKFLDILQAIEKGTYKEEDFAEPEAEGDEEDY